MWLSICTAGAAAPKKLLVDVDGQRRRAFVASAPASGPLVIDLHGSLESARFQRRHSGTVEWVAEGATVVWPQSKAAGHTWNAGHCCGPAQWSDVNDLGFLDEIVAAVQPEAQEVWAVGFSNGAFLAEAWSCGSARITAVVDVGGGWLPEDCGAGPVAYLGVHGTADPVVPFEPGAGARTLGVYGFPGFEQNLSRWRQRNRCAGPSTEARYGDVVCRSWTCTVPTAACVVEGGGHTWPGQSGRHFNGVTSDVPLTDMAWSWLRTGSWPAR